MSKREWPLIVESKGGILHISRENAPSCKVRTECGRTIDFHNTYNGNADQLRNADDGGQLKGKYDWNNYKLCKRCGTPEVFAETYEEYKCLHSEFMERMRHESDYVNEKSQEAIDDIHQQLKAIVQESLGDQVENIGQSGAGVTFTLNLNGLSMKMELTPSSEQARSLDEELRNKFTEEYKQKEENKNG